MNEKILKYHTFHGTPRLKSSISSFLTDFIALGRKVDQDNVFCFTGATAAIDALAYSIADPSDVFLLPTPGYNRIKTYVSLHSSVDIWPVPMETVDDRGLLLYQLTSAKIENAFISATKAGKQVRGLVIVNPHNPLGTIINSKMMKQILKTCHRLQLHCIVDEIYSLCNLTIDANGNHSRNFSSVLSLDDIPDPQRTHCVFGISKLFPLAGFRTGFVITKNPALQKCLSKLSLFSSVSSHTMEIIASFFADKAWFSNVYLPCWLFLLRDSYELVVACLNRLAVPYVIPDAGLFIWINLSMYCEDKTFHGERLLFDKLLEHKLYIIPGFLMYSRQPGWFRVMFCTPRTTLTEGLSRLKQVLLAARSQKTRTLTIL